MPSNQHHETGHMLRLRARSGSFTGPTPGYAPGYLQGNVVILPSPYAPDFLRFCLNNPKPCPLVGITKPGSTRLPSLGDDIDISRDIPKYHVLVNGELKEARHEITPIWRDDFVTFVLGCSFTFEQALMAKGYAVRHIELKRNVPMYKTNMSTIPSGAFSGPVVVTMRPMKARDIDNVYAICSQYNHAHGAPLYFGDPADIGITDLQHPDYGDAVDIQAGEVPVFWACGVTTMVAIGHAKPQLCITHAPGHMLVSDIPDRDGPEMSKPIAAFFENSRRLFSDKK